MNMIGNWFKKIVLLTVLLVSSCGEKPRQFAFPDYDTMQVYCCGPNGRVFKIESADVGKLIAILSGARTVRNNKKMLCTYKIIFKGAAESDQLTINIYGKDKFSFSGVIYKKENADLIGLMDRLSTESD